jgi:hypothetical protein
MPEHLLQPSYVPPIPHAVDGIRVTECGGGVNIFPDRRTVSLDDISYLSLFEGKNSPIIREFLC